MLAQAEVLNPTSLDLPAIAANVAVLIAFLAAIWAGITKGLKELKAGAALPETPPATVQAATILENATLREWSETNRDAVHAIARLTQSIDDLRRAMIDSSDEMRAMRRKLDEVNSSKQ